MKKSKKLLSLLLTLALAGSLAACTTAEAPPSTPAPGTPTTSTPAPEPKADPVTINVAVLPDEVPMMNQLAESYKAIAPNVTVNLMEIPNTEYMDKMIVQLSGGSDIDMYWAGNNAQYADFISKGLAIPLDDRIAADKLDLAPYGTTIDGVKYDGGLYMLPVRNSIWVLYYNKDLFDAAGIDYPKDSMSYSEYRELAKKMTSGSDADKIWGAYIHTWPIAWDRYALQSGSTIIDTDLTPFVEALQYRLDLEADGSIMPYTEQIATSAHYRTEFLKGTLAMHIMGDFHVGQLRQAEANGELPFDWDIAASPVPDGVSANTTTGMPAGFCISSASKNQDAAWGFLKYVSGEDGAKVYVKAGFVPSYINDSIKADLKYDGTTKPEHIGVLLDQKVYTEYPAVPGINQVEKIFDEESQLAFGGERTAQQAIDEITRRVKELNLGN